jgi:glyoxylase-like metal-dependent hydrolase (beta-lactamase superfamily II)
MPAYAQKTPSSIAEIYQRLSKVQITTIKITDKLYALKGEEDGGTVGVFAGPDGVLMVDAQYAPLGDKIVAAIRKISDRPIRFLINTHEHMDHTGGNEKFGKMGTVIFARDEVRTRLARGSTRTNGTPVAPAPVAALPMVTYEGRVTFHMNGEEVELIPVPHAHTDGDTMVRFPGANAIMCGDIYGYHIPNIDRGTGGSLQGLLDGLELLIGLTDANTKIIPGHGPIVGRNAVIERRDMIMTIRNRVATLISEHKTREEVIAAKPLADYEGKFPRRGNDGDRFIGEVYDELEAAK